MRWAVVLCHVWVIASDIPAPSQRSCSVKGSEGPSFIQGRQKIARSFDGGGEQELPATSTSNLDQAKLSDSDILKLAISHLDLPTASLQQQAAERRIVNRTGAPRMAYIDLGANWANTLRLYEDLGEATWIAKKPWEVYAFEASPFIQPYLEEFTSFLNGQSARPALTIPPSGSSVHLNEYAARYGCPAAPDGTYDDMRSCMFETFRTPLGHLHPDPELRDSALIAKRLAVADDAPPAGMAARFVAVPAAAGAADGTLDLGAMTAEQMIRGGAISHPVEGLPEMKVPLVNVVSWFVDHFKEDDYVVMKMDIEGAEFPVLNALLDGGNACLIDVLAMECHADTSLGNCDQLMSRLAEHPCIKVLTEGENDYHGWDHYSTPDKYYPVDPRQQV